MSKLLYETLTGRIRENFEKLKANNPFYMSIFNGKLSAATFEAFLFNITYLTSQTPIQLSLAIEETKSRKLTKLMKYYKAKFREEVGHDNWGKEDIKGIQESRGTKSGKMEISPEMQAIIESNAAMIQSNPYHYFVYILFAEYFTVIAAPECLPAIEQACKIPLKQMTIVSNHAELDKLHIAHWAKEAAVVGDHGLSIAEHVVILDDVMARYNAFCAGLATRSYKLAS